MKLRKITYEAFNDYKKPHMFLYTCSCSGKCYKELGLTSDLCQNKELFWCGMESFNNAEIIETYLRNKITSAIVFGGLEPFEQFDELFDFIELFRNKYKRNDDIVIYTGFRKKEVNKYIEMLIQFENIIIKFGRYIPNEEKHYDKILGVELANDEQYAEKIS